MALNHLLSDQITIRSGRIQSLSQGYWDQDRDRKPTHCSPRHHTPAYSHIHSHLKATDF